MRLRSFTIVAIRLLGLMSIFYGFLMIIFMILTVFMFSEGRLYDGISSVLWLQLLLPVMMIVFGAILIAASRSLAGVISGGLED
jgi:hypothetical protein